MPPKQSPFKDNFDEFEWWNPWDWGGAHDEQASMWNPETRDFSRGLSDFLVPLAAGGAGFLLGGPAGLGAGLGLGKLLDSASDSWGKSDDPQKQLQSQLGNLNFGGQQPMFRQQSSSRRPRLDDSGRGKGKQRDIDVKRAKYQRPDQVSVQDSQYIDPLYNPQAFLGDLNLEKGRYRDKRDELEMLARQSADAPSIVDQQLSRAYQEQQAALATAAAGRSGPGFLEALQDQGNLATQRIADQGATARLQEDLGRQQLLQNTLGQIQSRDQAFTGLLGNIFGQGMDDSLNRYQMDTSKQLGLLSHNRALEQLALQKYQADIGQNLGIAKTQGGLDLGFLGHGLDRYKTQGALDLGYLGQDLNQRKLAEGARQFDISMLLGRDKFDIQKKAADPFSTQNILGNLGKFAGTETGQKWIGKAGDWVADQF